MEFKRNLAAFLVQDFEMERKKKAEEVAAEPVHDPNNMGNNRVGTADSVLKCYNQIMDLEAVIVEDLISPLIFQFKYFLPFHDTISYDPVARSCVLVKGGFLRKIVCLLWQFLVIYRMLIRAIPSLNEETPPENSKSSGLSMASIAKAAYFIFISFSCICFYVFWLKTESVCKIFNHVISLAEKLHLQHRSPSRTRLVKVVVHGSWIFVTLYILLTAILFVVQMVTNNSGKATVDANAYSNSSKKSGYQLDFTEIHSADDFILLQIFNSMTSFMNICSWMLTYFHLAAWGAMFRQLILLFYWRLRTKEEDKQILVISHEIRTFNKIGSVIDELNDVYGLSSLLGAICIVAYISTTVKNAFSGLSSVPKIGSGLHLLLSYIPMMSTSIMLAEIQRVAGTFADIIKEEFGRFTRECGDPAECLCGIAIVHYDLVTSNVGVKGLGFFTVSYSFITTIVSVIISYSILVIQLFPHDNSDIEV